MSKVAIVTDTTNCLPKDIIKEYGIQIAPVHLILDGNDYRDQVDISTAEFWRQFKLLKEMPTTGAAGPVDWADAIKEAAKSTDDIVCISLSKDLSATYASAIQAIDMVKSEKPYLNVELVDSRTATGALGFIVLEAARAAQAGKSSTEVVQVAHDMLSRAKFFMSPDTLKFLIRIGRAPKTAVIGDMLQVKPIIGMVNQTGIVESIGKAMGKHKSMVKMVDMVKEYIDTDKPIHVNVHYSDRIEDSEELKKIVLSRYECAEVFITEFTPVMAAAMGPVVGLSFFS